MTAAPTPDTLWVGRSGLLGTREGPGKKGTSLVFFLKKKCNGGETSSLVLE